jgi:hypothetical protein
MGVACILMVAVASAQDWQIDADQLNAQGQVYVFNVTCFPVPDADQYQQTMFSPAVNGNDLGVIRGTRRVEETPPGLCIGPATYVAASSYVRAYVDGNQTQQLVLNYWAVGVPAALPDITYTAWSYADIDILVMLRIVNGPQGFPAVVNYSWDHFGGLGGSRHETPNMEDSPTWTDAEMSISKTGEMLNGRFNFDGGPPSDQWGWNRLINQGGSFNSFIGDTLLIHVHIRGAATCVDPWPGGPNLDDPHFAQHGKLILSLGTPITNTPLDSTYASWFEFSTDIGSDAELSDPTPDGNEAFDPGDSYTWHGPLNPAPGMDGIRDDAILNGFDLPPDPPDPTLATAAPVGSMILPEQLAPGWFDLDGEDYIDLDLSQFAYGPGFPSIGQFVSTCIFEPEYMYISYDDDDASHYAWSPTTPTDSRSPGMGATYGQTNKHDEVIGLVVSAGPPALVYFDYGYLNEAELHPSLAPNPDSISDVFDDDVDALDIRDGSCSAWYFSCDHEATYGLDPGTIYEKIGGGPGGGYIPFAVDSIHFGIPGSTDIDAFSFCWLWDSTQNRNGLAVLFSVDDDDPHTPWDESGGLNPAIIYYSFLNGVSHPWLTSLNDDVDAITLWETPLYAGYANPPTPCLPVNNLTILLTAVNTYQLNFTAPQTGTYTVYGTPIMNLASTPPAPGWNNYGSAPVPAGANFQFTVTNSATQQKFIVIAGCP